MIITFYSFKGGVGRSMALANVANWLRLQNLRVAVIDWDLEAPGLECFFLQTPARRQEVQATPGLIDLLVSYKERFSRLPAEFFVAPGGEPDSRRPPALERRAELLRAVLPPLSGLMIHINPENQASTNTPTGSLAMLAPGLRDGDRKLAYARDVQSFDWAELYSKYDGAAFFAWMRAELERDFDVTLIDSRTGMTEVGGVCTREMADLVLALCAANDQNLEGSTLVVRSLFGKELNDMRGSRKLRAALIPARYDNGETTALLGFEQRFSAAALDLKVVSGDAASRGLDPKTVWELRLPYTPTYAYQERLCVGAPDANPDLLAQYQKLSRFVASMYLESLDDEQRARVEALGPELRKLAAPEKPTEDLEITIERAFATLSSHAQTNAAQVLCRFVDFMDPVDPSSVTLQSREKADFAENLQPLLDEFEQAQLLGPIHRSSGEPLRWRIPFPKAETEWGRLRRWIAEDIDFLAYRSELRVKRELGSRERGPRTVSARFLAAAERFRDRRHELSPPELLFLDSLTSLPTPWWRRASMLALAVVGVTILFVLLVGQYSAQNPSSPAASLSSTATDAPTASPDELLVKARGFELVGDVESAKRTYSSIIETKAGSEQAKVALAARGTLLFQEQRVHFSPLRSSRSIGIAR